GAVITFALNGLFELIPFLKSRYDGEFYIPSAVKEELIDTPSKSKKYAFEALRVGQLIKNGYLKVYDTSKYSTETEIITNMANTIFYRGNTPLQILNKGELDSLVLLKNIDAEAVVVDERTTRLLLENPHRLHKMLERKQRSKITMDKKKLSEFSKHFVSVRIIRSVELALIGIDRGFFKEMSSFETKQGIVKSLLWALKLNGCAISEREIRSLIKLFG
ncbi:MAG: hypothetical protein ACMXX5_01690, partial [Candidatus Woesearchaeota archaeon]